jgi:signal transduction histidine kinase
MAVLGDGAVTLVMGADLDVFAREIGLAQRALLTALPIALVLAGVLGWMISDRALRPVRKLVVATEGITAAGLDRRIEAEGEDLEFMRLVTVFNAMLDRLEKGFAQATRFSADAAHELKTPLAILQGELEAELQAAEAGSEQQGRTADLLEEVQRLKSIVQSLLLLSLADAGRLKPALRLHDLSSAVAEVVEEIEITAEGLRVTQDVPPDIWVMADPGLLTQVLRNLATNAARHNRSDGTAEFALRQAGAWVELRVSNSGGGIRPEDAERIFERFYRGDKSRGRATEGVGLGLSLSREIVRAHGGELVLEQSGPGRTTFLMTLPADPTGRSAARV